MSNPPSLLRCAVYTRKSTEDGLEQEFNSLDAQREACAAYIVSQRHEGWELIGDQYDDGGYSGGNLERPGLTRLLADVAAGKVDVIVIYKIDRLTRSLSDFSRIVDVLDKADASFVSITQAFNTTTSMGRLTLNMLLSFAQFEREVTSERIRDKIAASKRKGLWMGGPVPLGYDVRERKLVVNEPEADLVRHIMRRYLAVESVRELVAELNREGRLTKIQNRTSGPHRGGLPFRRGTIFHLLKNRTYLGEIIHKGASYPGEHKAIVDLPLWQEVQARLAEHGSGSSRRVARSTSLLVGLIEDGLQRPMSPAHARKGTRRYRYYVTRPERLGQQPAWRVPAKEVEQLVISQMAAHFADQRAIYRFASTALADPREVARCLEKAKVFAAALSDESHQYEEIVRPAIEIVCLHEDRIAIQLSAQGLCGILGMEFDPRLTGISLSYPVARVRRGRSIRLVVPGKQKPKVAQRDERLVSLLAEADAARQLVLDQPEEPLSRIAVTSGQCRTRLRRLLSVSFLAPSIVNDILAGTQPASLTYNRLLNFDAPLDWKQQRAVLGFD
ncbi:MAG: hypothetical protein JWO16_68 [Sphingomonas bacterium]|nr:hypothetical protein [Sphingomonas bacterium]